MAGIHALAIACLLTFVRSESDMKLYLWFNGYRDGEKTFPAPFAVFEESNHSLMTCAKRCETEATCVSFFYSEPTGICQGCSIYHGTDVTGLPTMENSRYYYQTLGWKKFGASWYLLNKAMASCQKGQEICVAHGGNLVEIGTEQENVIVQNMVVSQTDGYGIFYIGLNRFSGSFKWYGSNQSPQYTNWRPDNTDTVGYDCVYINNHGYWKSTTPITQIGFICEKN